MARELEAWAIFGLRRQRPHLDKIMASPAECWGLLVDELWQKQLNKTPDAPIKVLRIVEMRRLGYSCRKVQISWRNLRQ